mgnify:FL=1
MTPGATINRFSPVLIGTILLVSAALSFGTYFLVSESFENKLRALKEEHLSAVSKLGEETNDLTEKVNQARLNTEALTRKISEIKLEEAKSKLASPSNDKKDIEAELLTKEKIPSAIKDADEKAKIIISREDFKDLIQIAERNKLAQSAIASNFEMKHFEKGKAIKVPETKDNSLLSFINKAIAQEKETLSANSKLLTGKEYALVLSQSLAKGKEKLFKSLPKPNEKADVLELEFPDFETLETFFPSKDNYGDLNLYFALEYFPKNKTKLEKIIQNHSFKKKEPMEIVTARQDWMNKHWKPMEEIIAKVGITKK